MCKDCGDVCDVAANIPANILFTLKTESLRIDTIEPLPAGVVISEEQRLLRLWSALHPQGRRATLGFIATLVAEEV
jgi:hypothetical protein